MTIHCNGENCRTPGWMRLVLLSAGIYHIFFAVWVNMWPLHCFDLLALMHPNHVGLWRGVGLVSAGLGLAFLLTAKNPVKHWNVVLIGFLKFCVVTAFVGYSIFSGELPFSALGLLILDDMIWLGPFFLILWISIRAHSGIPVSRTEPYSIEEAAAAYKLSSGESLADASNESPLVLVFLRHFGCTFTRQILRGLQGLEQEAKQNNAKLVLVHMLQSGKEINYLGQNSNVPRIADPRCELYRAFGLGKGGFLELFSLQVLWRGAISMFKGCGVGHLAGDGLQMPGAFVFEKGKIISSQPAQTAADLPDLPALFGKATTH